MRRLSRTYFIRYTYRGKQVREKTGLTDPRAAYEVLIQRLEEIRRGRLIGPRAERIRLEQLEQLVLDDHINNGYTTTVAVRRRFRYLREWFGDARMMDVTLADLNAYIRARRVGGPPFTKPPSPRHRGAPLPAKPAAPGTIFLEVVTLKHAFKLAKDSRLLPDVPVFPKIELRNVRKVSIERPTLLRLFEHTPTYLRPVLEVGLLTGWRKEAILSRERRHADIEARQLTLDGEWAKNGEPIVLPLVGRLLEIFQGQDDLAREVELRTGRVIPWCFFYPADAPPNVKAGQRIKDFDNQWRRSCAAAGMPHLHFHDLRRGAIRTLRRAGNDQHEIMEWVGLKTDAVFRRYDIVDDERMRDTARRQQEYYERQQAEAPKVTPIRREG